jgi:cytochrome c553
MANHRNRLAALLGSVTLGLLAVTFLASREATPTAAAALPPGHPAIPELNAAAALDALVPTSRNDFFLPGTQPTTTLGLEMPDPVTCADSNCHLGYDTTNPEQETMFAWQGSMMANSARDPVFYAALDIANADAAFVGEWCVRCHAPRAFYGERGAADGSQFTGADFDGVQCETCHWMVDPFYEDANPAVDLDILTDIDPPLTTIGSGALILETADRRRGPFDVVADLGFDPHAAVGQGQTLQSPYHREAALCGSCHDISNPVFTWDEASGSYIPGPMDEPGDLAEAFPIERTYSEWLLSDYNTPEGIYAPQFGGNKSRVSTCQDCHMRDVTGAGGAFFGGTRVLREDMPLHDLTGANTWVPETLPLHPEFGDDYAPWQLDALEAGAQRARYMLQNAATLSLIRAGTALSVTVTNETGHKLPTGYPEGRRMWLQVEGYNEAGQRVFTSGGYDAATGALNGDPQLQVYETHQGLTEEWASQLGLPSGASFHFALNNMIVKDNRIPPRGYDFVAFAAAGAAPVTDGQPDPTRYAADQYWDTVPYHLPESVAYGVVRLLFQTSSREYIEFLRSNNPNPADPDNRGEILYDLWLQTGRSEPVVMAELTFGLPEIFLPTLVRN